MTTPTPEQIEAKKEQTITLGLHPLPAEPILDVPEAPSTPGLFLREITEEEAREAGFVLAFEEDAIFDYWSVVIWASGHWSSAGERAEHWNSAGERAELLPGTRFYALPKPVEGGEE